MSDMNLPLPKDSRWKPLRSGLINLFHYANEQFWYEDGRLLLRGNNGTGKSRVLALQLPFLLDAQLSPTRMEPDRSASKRPEWNLLLGGKHRDRLGYTWIEFGRLNEASEYEYFTLGCGLHAVEHRGAMDSWFFTTTDRMDRDLSLVVDAVPLTKSRLSETLGEAGQMYRTQGDYRRAVDEKLFRLGPRYGSLIDLLIQLRVPQLSRDFDEKRMSEQLSSALPPLPADVLAQVADAMRDLDEQRQRLEEMRRSAIGVRKFRDHYRGYLRIALKRRVNDFLTAQSKYEATVRSINENKQLYEAAISELLKVESEQLNLEKLQVEVRAKLDTLKSRPEMTDAQRLIELRSEVRADSQRADQANVDVSDAKIKREHANSHVQLLNTEYEWELKRVRTSADELVEFDLPVSVTQHLRSNVDPVLQDQSQLKQIDAVEQAYKVCQEATKTLLEHQRQITLANNEVQKQLELQIVYEGQLEQQQQVLATRLHDLQVLAEKLRRDLLDWYDASQAVLSELPERDIWMTALDAESDVSDASEAIEANPLELLRDRINQAIENRFNELSKLRHELEGRIAATRSDLSVLTTRKQDLIDGVDLPPQPSQYREDDVRATRSGAPLYELCDFQDSIDADQRAMWEAGLQASGLLDAWVTLDGRLENPLLADVTLLANDSSLNQALPSDEASSLSNVLQPSQSLPDGMSDGLVWSLLRGIGRGKNSATTWVDADGSWQVGSLQGAWSKSEVQHIGAAAREQNRLRELDKLASQIDALEQQLETFVGELSDLDHRKTTVQQSRKTIPSDDAFRNAVAARRQAQNQCWQIDQTLTQQLARVEKAKILSTLAIAKRDKDASDLGLADRVETLPQLDATLRNFVNAFRLWRQELIALHKQNATLQYAQHSELAAIDLLQKQTARAAALHEIVVQKSARLQTLEANVGQSVEKVLADIRDTEIYQQKIEIDSKAIAKQIRNCDATKVQLGERLRQADELLKQQDSERRSEVGHFENFCELGLAKQALESFEMTQAVSDMTIPDGPWSPTRAAALAKQMRDLLRDVSINDKAWDTAQNETQLQFRTLEQTLLPIGITPQSQSHDEIAVVSVAYQGVLCSPSDLARQWNEEVQHRESLITREERELFEQRLIGDIAQALHDNIRQADALCQRMNVEVEKRPMSTGMRLRFRWHPLAQSSDELKIACKALMRKPTAMSDVDREALGRFLQQQIAEARSRDDLGTWQQHLQEALDYRLWFTFDTERETDGRWQRLTRRSHGTGSGGERAVALIIPMLAALAGYYHSADPTAPRIILMDEAFVGIDNEMRAKFMDLMVQFDLDFVMTSEREWGCYPTMPALAIYHLSTRHGIDAILPTRWVWNGNGKVQSNVHDLQ